MAEKSNVREALKGSSSPKRKITLSTPQASPQETAAQMICTSDLHALSHIPYYNYKESWL